MLRTLRALVLATSSSKSLAPFLPGIVSALARSVVVCHDCLDCRRLLTGDFKQGQFVFASGLKALAAVLTVVMCDDAVGLFCWFVCHPVEKCEQHGHREPIDFVFFSVRPIFCS